MFVSSSDGGAGPFDAGDPVTGAELCLTEWPQPDGVRAYGSHLAMDAAGNAFIAVDFVGGPNPFATGTTPSTTFAFGVAVAKIDDECRLVWSRTFGAMDSGPYGSVGTNALGVDGASNVTILGAYQGAVDLGTGTIDPGTPDQGDAFILRLDADGDLVFSKRILTQRVDALIGVADLAVDTGGVSTIAMQTMGDTDFGNGPDLTVAAGDTTLRSYLVQFDGRGNVVFRKALSAIASSVDKIVNLAPDPSGGLWAAGTTGAEGDSGNESQPVTLLLTSSGALTWVQPGPGIAPFETAIAAGPLGAVELTGFDIRPTGEPDGIMLRAYSLDGTSPWTRSVVSTSSAGYSNAPPYRGLVVDRNGQAIAAAAFTDTLNPGEAVPIVSAGGLDLQFQSFDPQGRLLSQGRWGGPGYDQFGGVGVDPAGNVVLAGSTSQLGGSDNVSRFFVVKLQR